MTLSRTCSKFVRNILPSTKFIQPQLTFHSFSSFSSSPSRPFHSFSSFRTVRPFPLTASTPAFARLSQFSQLPLTFNVRKFSSPASSAKKPVSEIKVELGNLIAQEVESLSKIGGADVYNQYLKLTNSTIKLDDGEIIVSSQVKDYDIKLRFSEHEEDVENEEEEVEEEAEKKAEGEGEDEEDHLKAHHFTIDLKQRNKEGPILRFHSIAGKDNKLYFEALEFFKNVQESESIEGKNDVMDFEGLSTEIQDKMCDLLDTLHLDDKVAAFVHVARHESQRQTLLSRMNTIEQLLVK